MDGSNVGGTVGLNMIVELLRLSLNTTISGVALGQLATGMQALVAVARKKGQELSEELREVRGVGRIKERWRWSFSPTGAREQLVLFNHGQVDGEEDQEVRAVILESSYGRGLYYASAASRGREYSFYDGVQVTREEYVESWTNSRGCDTRWR